MRGLADVSMSAAAAVGVPGFTDTLGVGECRQVVLVLIDGLGFDLLAAHADFAPVLAGLPGEAISAAFPTTTPVGLGTFGTGLPPGSHGLVGASFWLPESEIVLNPLHWGGDPVPVAVQPEPTVFERVSRAGVPVHTVSPAAYVDSGLTRAALRGAAYLPADDADQRVAQLSSVLRANQPSFTYVYWFELDRIGHEFGVDSDEWRAALTRVDNLIARVLDVLPGGTTMIVTADHGMVDCPPDARIVIDDDPRLLSGVSTVAGEPRARHVYVEHGAEIDVRDTWRALLGDQIDVISRQEVIEAGLLGDVDPALAPRVGDVMAISRGKAMLASRVDPTLSRLRGQHGALTPAEVRIPALVHRVS